MIDRITAAGGAPAQGPYSHAVKAGGFIQKNAPEVRNLDI